MVSCWDYRGRWHETTYELFAPEDLNVGGLDQLADGLMFDNRRTKTRHRLNVKARAKLARVPIIRRLVKE